MKIRLVIFALVFVGIIYPFAIACDDQGAVLLERLRRRIENKEAIVGIIGLGRITSYNVCYTKLLRDNHRHL